MKQKIVILVFSMCFACGLIAFAAVCNRPCFRGSRTADAHTYRLEIERMTGTDTHTLELEAGDTLQIQFETVKGTLHLTIQAPDGTVLYEGNGKGAADFTVTVPARGAYDVILKARRAQGSIHIQTKPQ